jgi:hypothetical protein
MSKLLLKFPFFPLVSGFFIAAAIFSPQHLQNACFAVWAMLIVFSDIALEEKRYRLATWFNHLAFAAVLFLIVAWIVGWAS